MTAAGYSNITSSAENAYAYATSPAEAMEAFLIDWGVPSDGHRINIQQPGVSPQNAFTDAGVGLVQTNPSNPNFGPDGDHRRLRPQLELLAATCRSRVQRQRASTNFYQPGEGQGGVQIDAVNVQTGQVLSTQTWSSGGYELPLPAGQYRIIASVNDTVVQTSNVTISNVNVEQDFVLTQLVAGWNTRSCDRRGPARAGCDDTGTDPQPTPVAMAAIQQPTPVATAATQQSTPAVTAAPATSTAHSSGVGRAANKLQADRPHSNLCSRCWPRAGRRGTPGSN